MTRSSFNAGWGYRLPLGPFEAAQSAGAELVPVTLPHDALRDTDRTPDADSAGGGAYYPRGAFTYLKTFDVVEGWAGRTVRLEFQGAYRHAMVFVNDEFAGNRGGGYSRFFVDITPYLRYGSTNEVRVEVRSGRDSRWYSGCGLHRSVLLHVDEPVHVLPDGVQVTTLAVEDDQAVVEVVTRVVNQTRVTTTPTLSTTITDPDGATVEGDATPVTLAPGETATVRQRLYLADPQLWDVDGPRLYAASTSLDSGAAIQTSFGVRTVQVDPRKGLRINGRPVLLRGACIHHDNGPLGAAAIARAEERRIELLKAAGFNAIRAAHNPVSEAMLAACDRHGVLVMDEAFDMWHRGKTPEDYALDFEQWWEADLESMVAKDYNHPSVILYSIGNEIAETGTPHGARMARRLAEKLRGLDPTRLVTNGVNTALTVLQELSTTAESGGGLNDLGDAMNRLGSSELATQRTVESSSVLDVLGLNYAEGRYASDRERFPHRVIVGSETFPTRIGALWPMVLDSPNVIGDFTWTGWDYLGEVGIGATGYAEGSNAVASLEREFPWLTAWCGDLDLTGWRRPVSYYREIVFGLRTEPYVAVRRPEHHDHTVTVQSPWAWSDSVSSWTWPGYEDREVDVEVYADADEVALLLDGTEVLRRPVSEQQPMLTVLPTVYRPGELTAVAYRDGVETGRTTLTTSGPPRLTLSPDRVSLRADDEDLAYLEIELRDIEGRLVNSADRQVRIQVEGAGELVGFCSANPSTTERFDATTRTTFDGRALAVVRPTGAGSITVTASAEDLDFVTVQLRAEALLEPVHERPS